MTETVLYARGACRVLEFRDDAPARPWIVVDTAGTRLHEAISFEAARDWVDRREAPDPHPTLPGSRRTRGMR